MNNEVEVLRAAGNIDGSVARVIGRPGDFEISAAQEGISRGVAGDDLERMK